MLHLNNCCVRIVVLQLNDSCVTAERATTLRKVTLPVRECKEFSNEDVTYSPVSTLLCTESFDVMACAGDSGGPLMYNADGRTVLVGLLSFGEPDNCTSGEHLLRNAFTRVSSFMPWILDNIEP